MIGEHPAAFYQSVQNARIHIFVYPLTLAEYCGILILLSHNINFRLASCGWIRTPPPSEIPKKNGRFSIKQKPPQVLCADIFKYLSHIVGQVWLDSPVSKVRGTEGNDGVIFRYKPIPETEEVVCNGINGFSGGFFSIGRFFSDQAERRQVLQITGTDAGILSGLCGDFRHAGGTGGDGGYDRIVKCRFPYLLFEQVFRFFEKK